jgi:hypothetical protein
VMRVVQEVSGVCVGVAGPGWCWSQMGAQKSTTVKRDLISKVSYYLETLQGGLSTTMALNCYRSSNNCRSKLEIE